MGRGTAIGRVRGLGSARQGAHHWWHQRLTAAGNLALVLWFVISLLRLPALDHATVVAWLSSPVSAVLMILMTVSVFYHLRLGLQVIIEDYQHDETRVVAIVLLNFYAIGGAALATIAILKITLGAVAP